MKRRRARSREKKRKERKKGKERKTRKGKVGGPLYRIPLLTSPILVAFEESITASVNLLSDKSFLHSRVAWSCLSREP